MTMRSKQFYRRASQEKKLPRRSWPSSFFGFQPRIVELVVFWGPAPRHPRACRQTSARFEFFFPSRFHRFAMKLSPL